jgi:transcriptional regulator with PAS, ATPase and Fis domain
LPYEGLHILGGIVEQIIKVFQEDTLAVFDDIRSGILFTNKNQEIIYANKKFLEIFNTDLESIQKKKCGEVLHPVDQDCSRCYSEECTHFDVEIDKVRYTILLTSSVIQDSFLMKIIQDISKIMKSISGLTEEVRELRRIVDGSVGRGELITICAHCNKVRLKDGSWMSPQDIDKLSVPHGLSHGLCPLCANKELDRLKKFRG